MDVAEHDVSGDPIAGDEVGFVAVALRVHIRVDGRHGRCCIGNEKRYKIQKMQG